MGMLYFIVNDTKKEYIDSTCKITELYLDKRVMETLIELLRDEWEHDKIAIYSESQLKENQDLKPIPLLEEEENEPKRVKSFVYFDVD